MSIQFTDLCFVTKNVLRLCAFYESVFGGKAEGDEWHSILGIERLKTTCFGNEDDGVGECFDTSLVVLRFLAAVTPNETEWMQSRINTFHNHLNDKKRPWFSLWYFWLCLSELPSKIAEPEIIKYKDQMLPWLTTKSAVMNSEHDKTIHPVIICSL